MGVSYDYRCPRCGYGAQVSGGLMGGMFSTVLTIDCRDCQELHDVGFLTRTYEEQAGGAVKVKYIQHRLRCPNDAGHQWELFHGGCPKCSTHLEVDREMPALHWD